MPRSVKIIVITAVLLVVALTAFGLTNGSTTSPKTSPAVGRISELEQSGAMHTLLEQHRQMLQRMQSDASPAMLEIMKNDPIWQMMRTPEWAQLDLQHEQELNRSLGRS